MGLDERIDSLTGLLIALIIYLILRWAQRRWPDAGSKDGRKHRKDCKCDCFDTVAEETE